MTFEELNISPEIRRAIIEMGFENPMPVQEKVIPLVLDKRNDIIFLSNRTRIKDYIDKGKIPEPILKKDIDRQRAKSKNTIGWEVISL